MLRQIIKTLSNHSAFNNHSMAIRITPTPNSVSSRSSQSVSNTTTPSAEQTTEGDFDEQLINASDPVALLESTLSAEGYIPRTITLGQTLDPYRVDATGLATTRQLLEVLFAHHHPVHICTKSHLIVKDIELLTLMAKAKLCSVTVGLSTLDNDLKMNMEPRTSSPSARFSALNKLSAAGVPVSVMVAPIIPLINDAELENVLSCVKASGVRVVGYELLQLSNNIKPMFQEWLQQHYPAIAKRVINLVYCSYNGRDERSEFSKSMSSSGAFAIMLEQRFVQACTKQALQPMAVTEHNSTFKVAP